MSSNNNPKQPNNKRNNNGLSNELDMPTVEEIFGNDKWPDRAIPDSSPAWELADMECARLLVGALNDGAEDDEEEPPPAFTGFYNSLADLYDAKTEPADYVLLGCRRRQVTIVVSTTNAGKSTLLMNHTLAAAGGMKWAPLLPEAPKRPLKVMYFDGESTDDELKNETITMLDHIGGQGDALINFIPIVEPHIKGESLDFTNREHLKFVKAFVAQHQPDIIVIDTIGSLFTLINENDNAEVKRKVIRPLKDLAKIGNSAVIAAHHIGNVSDKDEQAYLGRGASAFGTDTRAVFTLKKEKELGEGYVKLSLAKAKGVKFDPLNLRLDFEKRSFEIVGAPKSQPDETPYQKIIGACSDNPLSPSELGAIFPTLALRTIKRYLQSALEKGDLVKQNRGKYCAMPEGTQNHAPKGSGILALSPQVLESKEVTEKKNKFCPDSVVPSTDETKAVLLETQPDEKSGDFMDKHIQEVKQNSNGFIDKRPPWKQSIEPLDDEGNQLPF